MNEMFKTVKIFEVSLGNDYTYKIQATDAIEAINKAVKIRTDGWVFPEGPSRNAKEHLRKRFVEDVNFVKLITEATIVGENEKENEEVH